jgi:dethiobiotin synthetase
MSTRPATAAHVVVCGTDTDVGKSLVSALLVQGLGACYWKPVQSGLEQGGDRAWVADLLELPLERQIPEVYAFHAPVSPHWAAEMEGETIVPERLVLPPPTRLPLVIETAGGLHVPLNRRWLQIDQLEQWKLPVLLVARSGLGTLNHTLLSLEALKRRSIPVLGLVLNGPLHDDNPGTLEQFGGVPVLAEIPPLDRLDAAALALEWQRQQLGPKFGQLL